MSSTPGTVLVIDDEVPIQRLLRSILSVEDYRVLMAGNAADGLMYVRHDRPDVIILDLGLPDMDGLDVLRELRRLAATPVIVLSARDAERQKVEAFDIGADDYVTKPFGAEELLARIKVAFRHRVQEQGGAPVLKLGEIEADLVHRRITRAGLDVRLSPREYDLLAQLLIHAGKVVTHRHLLRTVWKDEAADPQYLRVYMRQLRQKLEPDPARPRHLLTEPGIGYRLEGFEAG